MAQTGLTWRLAVDLLDKMNNPDNHQHYSEVDDDDLEVMPDFIAFTFKIGALGNLSLLKEIEKEIKLVDVFQSQVAGNVTKKQPLPVTFDSTISYCKHLQKAVNVNNGRACGEVSFAKMRFHVLPFPHFLIFSPSTLLFQLESTSHLCGSQRGGTSAFLKDHCAFLPSDSSSTVLSTMSGKKKP